MIHLKHARIRMSLCGEWMEFCADEVLEQNRFELLPREAQCSECAHCYAIEHGPRKRDSKAADEETRLSVEVALIGISSVFEPQLKKEPTT